MTLKLEVGKTYRRRDGQVRKIVGGCLIKGYEFTDERGMSYTAGGAFHIDGRMPDVDLVEEVAEDEPQPGEWWEMESLATIERFRIGYCIGRDENGQLAWKDSEGDISTEWLVFQAHKPVRHLPDCTGFDYAIPAKTPDGLPEGRCRFSGASWYRLAGGKCVELDKDGSCDVGTGFLVDTAGDDGGWMWGEDGAIAGITPANGEPIEDWYLAEKLDGPPPELPEGHEHLHPPECIIDKPDIERAICKLEDEGEVIVARGFAQNWRVRIS